MAEDARRRDFTMNALYADGGGPWSIRWAGCRICAPRRVRFIGDPAARIREDYLRILRFFRFHAWYGDPQGGIDAEGLAACAGHADGLVHALARTGRPRDAAACWPRPIRRLRSRRWQAGGHPGADPARRRCAGAGAPGARRGGAGRAAPKPSAGWPRWGAMRCRGGCGCRRPRPGGWSFCRALWRARRGPPRSPGGTGGRPRSTPSFCAPPRSRRRFPRRLWPTRGRGRRPSSPSRRARSHAALPGAGAWSAPGRARGALDRLGLHARPRRAAFVGTAGGRGVVACCARRIAAGDGGHPAFLQPGALRGGRADVPASSKTSSIPTRLSGRPMRRRGGSGRSCATMRSRSARLRLRPVCSRSWWRRSRSWLIAYLGRVVDLLTGAAPGRGLGRRTAGS